MNSLQEKTCPDQKIQLLHQKYNFRKRAGYFRLKVEQISVVEVAYLDAYVYKNENTGYYAIKPKFKPTSLGTPLSFKSGHHVDVLRAWPKAEMSRLCMLASSHADRAEAMQTFIGWVTSSFTLTHIIIWLQRCAEQTL